MIVSCSYSAVSGMSDLKKEFLFIKNSHLLQVVYSNEQLLYLKKWYPIYYTSFYYRNHSYQLIITVNTLMHWPLSNLLQPQLKQIVVWVLILRFSLKCSNSFESSYADPPCTETSRFTHASQLLQSQRQYCCHSIL